MSSIEDRLRKLEMNANQSERLVIEGLATVAHVVPKERKDNMTADQRVLIDWYRIVCGTIWGRERFSNDPAERGRCCEPSGYLLEVVRELHEECSYREQPGSCATCQGTPVAHRPPP